MKPHVFLTQLLPLVVFIIADALVTDVRVSIACAVAFAVAQLAVTWVGKRRFDWFVLVDVGLIAVLGGMAIGFNNQLLFKIKPAIIEALGALFLLGLRVAPDRFLLGYVARLSPGRPLRPEVLGAFRRLLAWLCLYTTLHLAAVLYTAFYASKQAWAWVSGPGFYLVLVPLAVHVLIKRRQARTSQASAPPSASA